MYGMKKLAFSIVLLLTALPAYAQFGGSVVFDPTTDSDVRLDTQVNAVAARSLITPGAVAFQSNAGYLQSLQQNLGRGISSQQFPNTFPGWSPLGPNAAQTAKQIADAALTTYAGAISVAEQQGQNFAAEDAQLARISAQSHAVPSVLAAIQANTDAALANAQQTQLLRQQLNALIVIEATKAAFQLNNLAQAGATTAKSHNMGGE
jgi:hypothetical protein